MSTISASTTTTTAYKVTADTTGTLVLQTGSTPTTAVTIGTDQTVTFAKQPAGNFAGTGPAFSVYMTNGSANYSVSSNVDTVVPLDTKIYDTATAFNNTSSTATLNGISVPAYSFAPNVAGYYQINILFRAVGTISSGPYCYINKNGSNFLRPVQFATIATNSNISGSGLVYLNGVSDYITFAANMSGAGLAFGFNGATSSCAMSGYLARAA